MSAQRRIAGSSRNKRTFLSEDIRAVYAKLRECVKAGSWRGHESAGTCCMLVFDQATQVRRRMEAKKRDVNRRAQRDSKMGAAGGRGRLALAHHPSWLIIRCPAQ